MHFLRIGLEWNRGSYTKVTWFFVFWCEQRPAITFLKSKNFQLFVKKQLSLIIIPRSGYCSDAEKSDRWIWMLTFHSDWQKNYLFCCIFYRSDWQDFQNQSKWLACPKRFQHLSAIENLQSFVRHRNRIRDFVRPNKILSDRTFFSFKACNFGHIMILGLNISPI